MEQCLITSSPKTDPKLSFLLLKFSSLVFLEIAEDDNVEHCLHKNPGKKFREPQIGFEIRVGFLPYSQGSIISFP